MVDALRRASRWIRRDGGIVDLHPTALVPTIDVDGRVIGRVDAPGGPARHAAADAALRQAQDAGLLVETSSHTFPFHTWGDTFEELRAHIEENWPDARVVLDVPAPPGRCRATERVRITKLARPGA